MTGQPPGRLIRSSQVETARGWPAWFTAAHAEFQAVLLAEPTHPCHFGVAGERADHNWFTALDERQQGRGVPELAETLASFATVALTGPSKQSLVVVGRAAAQAARVGTALRPVLGNPAAVEPARPPTVAGRSTGRSAIPPLAMVFRRPGLVRLRRQPGLPASA